MIDDLQWRQSEQFKDRLRALARDFVGRRTVEDLRSQLARPSGQPTPEESARSGLYIKLARQLEQLKEDDEARAVFRQACAEEPNPGLYEDYIDFLAEHNRTREAIEVAEEGLRRFPDSLLLRLKEALALPVVYDTRSELEDYRRRFSDRLRDLEAGLTLDTPRQRENALAAVCGHVNFYLGYQMNDCRELHERYANFVHRVLAACLPEFIAPCERPRAPRKGRIRVGYISTLLTPRSRSPWKHVVARTFGEWISHHNPEKFEVFCYNPRRSPDLVPPEIPEGCEHYRHLPGDLRAVCTAIRTDDLDALVFLDVGTVRRMTPLACLRLAPVQCATWGHPITTGSPNIDYFLSSAAMEPADADLHYSERLVRLPGLGICYTKPVVSRPDLNCRRSCLGLRDDAILYLCSQSVFKYTTDHDDLLAQIASRVPASQFVFQIGNSDLQRAVQRRLDRAFSAVGLDAKAHCALLPRAPILDYLALTLASDVFLDTLGFSGFNTTMDAIACGLPVVTLPGKFMRGRQSYAILTQLGVTDTIARDKEEYIDIAVRLGSDPAWRKQVAGRMAERESRLFSDTSSVVALEQFLTDAVRENLPT
jgi:predicted O-linked N-acetylglucosamine transferase (SPINDLY family)